jgi:hypothetical protein
MQCIVYGLHPGIKDGVFAGSRHLKQPLLSLLTTKNFAFTPTTTPLKMHFTRVISTIVACSRFFANLQVHTQLIIAFLFLSLVAIFASASPVPVAGGGELLDIVVSYGHVLTSWYETETIR